MATLQLKTLTCIETEDKSPLNVPSNPNLLKPGNVMKKILTALLVTVCAGLFSGNASAQKEKWGGENQRCAVENCNTPSPPPPASSNGSEEQNNAKSVNARYRKIHKDVNRVLASVAAYSSFNAKMDAYQYALDLLRQQQALRDGPNVQNSISQVETLILWTRGVIDDQNKVYWKAVQELREAYNRRPELFSEGNFNYMQDVMMRQIRSLPNRSESLVLEDPSVVVPDKVFKEAISDRVFYQSPPGVSDRVRKGFQAVMVKDWKVAKAWFQDALYLEPDNANLKSFIAIIDEPEAPEKKTEYLRQGPDSGTNMAGDKLPTRFTLQSLNANAWMMNNEQIMKALGDIILLQFMESSK